ncbi:cupin-like domain-containing protein [bacterium SCSIO 12741]|nr:cupin-like domain-containing protein [bacterium SCSIO 12741]
MPIDFSKEIETVDRISYKDFQENFMKPQRPVKIKHLLSDSEANRKWTPDYFKRELGHHEIGVFNGDKSYLDRSYKTPPEIMKFSQYIDLILSEPTDKRLFLFDVFKLKPELKNDFEFPDIADRILKKMPFTFFGGQGAVTRIHRDMDNANVFLTEFWGKKFIALFPPSQDEALYRYPFSVHSAVEIEEPDYDKFPALHHARGQHTVLEKGETLFMPCKYWHYIRYMEPGIGMSFRSLGGAGNTISGLWQAGVISTVDDLMRKSLGEKWFDWKTKQAAINGDKVVQKSGALAH